MGRECWLHCCRVLGNRRLIGGAPLEINQVRKSMKQSSEQRPPLPSHATAQRSQL